VYSIFLRVVLGNLLTHSPSEKVCEGNQQTARPMIFVAGLARSGTTLFQTIFSRHPRVFSFPETHFFEAVASLRLFDRQLDPLALDLLGAELIRRDGLDAEEWGAIRSNLTALGCSKISVDIVFNTIVKYYQDKTPHQPTDYALEKTPGHVFQLDRILLLYPEAHVFLLQRNLRDYANSISKVSWGPGTIQGIGALWSETIKMIDSFAQQVPEKVTVVDYEQLVEKPGMMMAKCFERAGLEFRNEYLENLSAAGEHLVKRSEMLWKSHNLQHDTVANRKEPSELSLRQRIRLILAVRPVSMWRYKLRSLRH